MRFFKTLAISTAITASALCLASSAMAQSDDHGCPTATENNRPADCQRPDRKEPRADRRDQGRDRNFRNDDGRHAQPPKDGKGAKFDGNGKDRAQPPKYGKGPKFDGDGKGRMQSPKYGKGPKFDRDNREGREQKGDERKPLPRRDDE